MKTRIEEINQNPYNRASDLLIPLLPIRANTAEVKNISTNTLNFPTKVSIKLNQCFPVPHADSCCGYSYQLSSCCGNSFNYSDASVSMRYAKQAYNATMMPTYLMDRFCYTLTEPCCVERDDSKCCGYPTCHTCCGNLFYAIVCLGIKIPFYMLGSSAALAGGLAGSVIQCASQSPRIERMDYDYHDSLLRDDVPTLFNFLVHEDNLNYVVKHPKHIGGRMLSLLIRYSNMPDPRTQFQTILHYIDKLYLKGLSFRGQYSDFTFCDPLYEALLGQFTRNNQILLNRILLREKNNLQNYIPTRGQNGSVIKCSWGFWIALAALRGILSVPEAIYKLALLKHYAKVTKQEFRYFLREASYYTWQHYTFETKTNKALPNNYLNDHVDINRLIRLNQCANQLAIDFSSRKSVEYYLFNKRNPRIIPALLPTVYEFLGTQLPKQSRENNIVKEFVLAPPTQGKEKIEEYNSYVRFVGLFSLSRDKDSAGCRVVDETFRANVTRANEMKPVETNSNDIWVGGL